jgi:hypothetical protein
VQYEEASNGAVRFVAFRRWRARARDGRGRQRRTRSPGGLSEERECSYARGGEPASSFRTLLPADEQEERFASSLRCAAKERLSVLER